MRHQSSPAARTVLGVVIVFPVFHEKTDDLVTLLFEQPRGDG